MKARIFILGIFLLYFGGKIHAQQKEGKEIQYTSERTSKNEEKYPGALLMYKVNHQVTFEHEGVKVWCDQAIFYKNENFFRASGNVKMVQGDTITLTSGYAEYDGNSQFAFASDNVHLQSPSALLTTDSLFFDRQRQEAFYRTGGTVRDTASTITSKRGQYFANQKKFAFFNNVVVTNPDYVIHSDRLDFYEDSGKAYLFGPTTIVGKESTIYCERGFYDTHKDKGYFVKNSEVLYQDRKVFGDSIYFDRQQGFASATNNITVIDSINQSEARGHYAEVYRNQDSVFITKKALVSRKQGKDTIHIHSDTIMVTGKPDHRVIRAFHNARFYKSDMNGKADSIYAAESKGITRMIGTPVIFSGLMQMTGDTIDIFNDTKTNKLDSLSVYNHAFMVQKDTLGGYNQVRGKHMYGLFKEDNKLDKAVFVKNTETVYYSHDKDDHSLMGIERAFASFIEIFFTDNEVSAIQYDLKPEGTFYRPKDLPENARRLKGFHWRGEERILSKEDLFKGDPPLHLPKIKGIPLPKDEGFFRQRKGKPRLKLNDKSRLRPEDLKNETENKKEEKAKKPTKLKQAVPPPQ